MKGDKGRTCFELIKIKIINVIEIHVRRGDSRIDNISLEKSKLPLRPPFFLIFFRNSEKKK